MDKIFVNFTNHPSKKWEEKQKREAMKYGKIVDVPFPAVDPCGDETYIELLAEDCLEKILQFHPGAVLCQGEFCLVYQVVKWLKQEQIPVLAACSERMVNETGRKKEVSFVFCRFREYV